MLLSKRQATRGPWKEFSEFKKYRKRVDKITEEWVKEGKVDNIHLRGIDYHLDHRFSVSHGFLKKIPEEIIGHYTNLEIIPAIDNYSKCYKCSKTKEQLYEDYERSLD